MYDKEVLMEYEEINQEQLWDASEITEIPLLLEPEIRTDVPGLDTAIVYGDPIRLGDILDCQQGFDNPYGAFGTCGETSIANICKMAGMDVTEPEVVEYAMENGLCVKDSPVLHGGDTTGSNQIDLLAHFGLDAHCEFARETATSERLAEYMEGGHGVLLCLNPHILYGREPKEGKEHMAGHAVCLTGTVRSVDGELKGFYLCDSWFLNPDSGRTYVPLERLEASFHKIEEGIAIITDKPIRS